MTKVQLPLMRGLKKHAATVDYGDVLPVNMLAVVQPVLNASGYMRSFPGLSERQSVDGASRGAEYNTKQSLVYRVCGGYLYAGGEQTEAVIPGKGRARLAHSYNSQGIGADGKLLLYHYDDKELKTLENWPERVIEQEGYEKTLSTWAHSEGSSDAFYVPEEAMKGKISITITPTNAAGVSGEGITIEEERWGSEINQEKPDDDVPWLTKIIVTGNKRSGTLVTLSWEFNGPGVDASQVSVDLTVTEVATDYAQYEIGTVGDICHNRSRYVWVKEGSDTFGVTDLEDESHPDRFRPFYRAESMPDGILGVDNWRDLVVCFGSATIEYFSLTGSSVATDPIYIAQPSLMVNVGIAGRHCKVRFGDSFAILSHPSSGAPSVYLIDSGSKKRIASRQIEKMLLSYSAEELAQAVMESVRFEAHELLIIHLARHVLCFDASVSVDGAQWCLLASGLDGAPHRAVDYLYDGAGVSVADKREGRIGVLDMSSAAQYDDAGELLLFTPLLKADNTPLFDFELESSGGLALFAEKLFLSATTDGITYGREQLVKSDDRYRYDARILWPQVGRCRKNIGFRVRLITRTPVSLAQCQLRVGYGK
ncbi:TPA: packaged DNA stabilization protein [Serratia marcescens]